MRALTNIRQTIRGLRQKAGQTGRVLGTLVLLSLLLSAFVRDLRQFPRGFTWRTIPLTQLWSPLLFLLCLVTILLSAVAGLLLRGLRHRLPQLLLQGDAR